MQPHRAAPNPPAMAPTPIADIMDADDSQLPAPPAPPPPVAAPPRPPNPELIALHARLYEKFTAELASLTASVAQENERLRGAQADLLKGEPAVRDEMARLGAVKDVCQTVRDQLAEVVNRAESAIASLERKGEPEVDELVCATNIVHNQCVRAVDWRLEIWTYSRGMYRLINLVAEDNAIEDTIYHLHRALNAGRLDLDKFLRVQPPCSCNICTVLSDGCRCTDRQTIGRGAIHEARADREDNLTTSHGASHVVSLAYSYT